MFPPRHFPERYFPPDYFAEGEGAGVPTDGSYFAGRYFAPDYFPSLFYPQTGTPSAALTSGSFFAGSFFASSYFATTYFPQTGATPASSGGTFAFGLAGCCCGCCKNYYSSYLVTYPDIFNNGTRCEDECPTIDGQSYVHVPDPNGPLDGMFDHGFDGLALSAVEIIETWVYPDPASGGLYGPFEPYTYEPLECLAFKSLLYVVKIDGVCYQYAILKLISMPPDEYREQFITYRRAIGDSRECCGPFTLAFRRNEFFVDGKYCFYDSEAAEVEIECIV